MTEWPLQDAKNKSTAPVNAESSDMPNLGELLLEIPQDDREFERLSLPSRPLDL